MGKLSRQERIGAMVLAAIALLITGGAFLLRRCVPSPSVIASPRVQVIHIPDTAVPPMQVIHIPDTAVNRQANDTSADKGAANKGSKENRERSRKHHGKKSPQKKQNPPNRSPYNPFDPIPLKQEP